MDRLMKAIQIPKTSNPFVVVINNTVHSYAAGETVEVPDEVAEAIEDALELVPKPKKHVSSLAKFLEGGVPEIKEEDLYGLEKITPYAFYNKDFIVSVEFPDGVSVIGESAFVYCDKLQRVTTPASLKEIHSKAFSLCSNLTRVIMKAKTPPIIQGDTFASISTDCVFLVPAKSLEAYKAAQNWSTLAGTYTFVVEE